MCFQTGCLTAQTLGGNIVCSGLLQGDARFETKGNGVSKAYLLCLYDVLFEDVLICCC